MDKDAFEAIGEQAVAAHGMRTFKAPGEPDHVYYLIDGNADSDVPRRVEAMPEPREHSFASLDSLIELAKREDPDVVAKPVLWYSRRGVTLVLDDATGRDRARMPLALSPQVEDLLDMEKNKRPMNQAALLAFLRINLRDCLGRAGSLVEIIRRVKWTYDQAGDSEIKHGKSSVGKSIVAEINGTGALPEYVEFEVPVFKSSFPNLRGVVECALEPDAATQTFRLIPLPGRIEAAIAAAEDALGDMVVRLLDGAEIPAYYGEP